MTTKTLRRLLSVGMIAACGLPASAMADPVADFYKGRTMKMIVGFSPGGGMDLYARLAAEHWGRFIPGNPSFIVQNMPGGGSVKATRHLFSASNKDGTEVAIMLPYVIASIMLRDDKTVRPAEFNWLGQISWHVAFAFARSDAPATTVAEARQKRLILGATSARSISATVSYALNSLAGTKIKVVNGYRGTSKLALALEKGEIQAAGAVSWALLNTRLRPWLDDGRIKLMWVLSPKRFPHLPNVPAVHELSNDPNAKPVLEFLGNGPAAGRSFAAPPGVPADRVAALRSSFMAMVKDPKFLAAAKKRKVDIIPKSGAEVQKIVAEVVATPAAVVERTRQAIKAPK